MIFNKTNNGTPELKALLGFIYASFEFKNIKTFIDAASRDLCKIIGKDFYKSIEAHYLSADFNLEGEEDTQKVLLNELVVFVQRALAFSAYRRYAPLTDVTHSDKGRQIFVSDEEKPAFEAQVERDNQELLKLEHEHLEALLELLYENIDNEPVSTTFAVSANFKKIKELFVNQLSQFEDVFPINGSYRLFLAITPFIREAERNLIRPCLSPEDWTRLKELILDMEDIDEDSDDFITLSLIRVPICLMAISIAAKRLGVTVLPDAVVQNYSSDRATLKASQAPLRADRIGFAKSMEVEANSALLSLQQHLSKITATAAGETFSAPDFTEYILPENKFVNL